RHVEIPGRGRFNAWPRGQRHADRQLRTEFGFRALPGFILRPAARSTTKERRVLAFMQKGLSIASATGAGWDSAWACVRLRFFSSERAGPPRASYRGLRSSGVSPLRAPAGGRRGHLALVARVRRARLW